MSEDRKIACPMCGRARKVDRIDKGDRPCQSCKFLAELVTHPLGPWVEDALCAQTDPEAFYPDSALSGAPEAKAVCRACPVRLECLTHALEADEMHGIWGGLSSTERRRLKKKGRAA